MRAEYERCKAASGTARRRSIAGSPAARTTPASSPSALYADRVPQFTALLAAEGGDLPRFYARVKALAALPKAEREAALLRGRGPVRRASAAR